MCFESLLLASFHFFLRLELMQRYNFFYLKRFIYKVMVSCPAYRAKNCRLLNVHHYCNPRFFSIGPIVGTHLKIQILLWLAEYVSVVYFNIALYFLSIRHPKHWHTRHYLFIETAQIMLMFLYWCSRIISGKIYTESYYE